MFLGTAALGFLACFLGLATMVYAKDEKVRTSFFFMALTIACCVGIGWIAARYEAIRRDPRPHMTSLLYYGDGLACVMDNNNPGKYQWVSADDFKREWDHLPGWCFAKPNGIK